MKNNSIILFIATTASATFGFASLAFARAGGGQDYVPAVSSGGSSGFSGGSSIGGLIVLIIIAVVVSVVRSYIRKASNNTMNNVKNNLNTMGSQTNRNIGNNIINNNVQRDIARGNIQGAVFDAAIGGIAGGIMSSLNKSFSGGFGAMGGGVDIQGELAKIKVNDPGFNEEAFKDKAQAAFFKVQEGWERQDTTIMRPYVSDAVLQRFTNQISDLKSRGEKDVLENIVIGHMDITNVRSDVSFNYITTKIDASAADYTLDSTSQIVKGSKTPTGFTEYWTFLRTVGVKTDMNKQLKDNKCPNCGAALEVNATGKCNYCGAIVTSGQFDWVLSEIQQR